MFLIQDFSIIDEQMRIKLSANDELKGCLFSFRLRDNNRFVLLEHNQEYNREPISNNKSPEILFNVRDFVKESFMLKGSKNIVDLYLKIGDNYSKAKVKEKTILEYIKNLKSIKLNDITELKPYITTDNSLAFQLIQKDVLSLLTDIKKDGKGNFEIEIKTKMNGKEDLIKINQVMLTRRVARDTTILFVVR